MSGADGCFETTGAFEPCGRSNQSFDFATDARAHARTALSLSSPRQCIEVVHRFHYEVWRLADLFIKIKLLVYPAANFISRTMDEGRETRGCTVELLCFVR